MSLEAECPQGHRLKITEAHLGKPVSCSICGTTFVVPKPGAPSVPGPGQVSVPPAGIGSQSALGPAASGQTHQLGMLRGLAKRPLLWGRPMMLVGLLLVIVSRGCYSVGNRAVGRAMQREQMARNRFDDQWEEKRLALEQQLEALEEKQEPGAEDAQRRTELRTALMELEAEKQKERQALERGEWRELRIAARDAAARHQMWAYWYEIFFVFASLLLVAGLLVVSWNAQGAERLVCLIILAIIAFSIYVGGIAWAQFPFSGST